MASTRGSDFGELLRRQRRAAGLTMEELAARAGLSARGIADLERGARRTPRRDTVALLVRALGASQEDEAALFAAARRLPGAATRPPTAPIGDVPSAAPDAQPNLGGQRTPNNLPAQFTRLLGRDEAVRTVAAVVRRPDVRLVTLTGPGGVGKTRLAIRVAAELLDDFVDGVYFVRLSRLVDSDLVLPTVAETLGLKAADGQPIAETLRVYLRERRLVLVLDNCEHVAAAAPAVAALLETCPALMVLATSRMTLRLRGEHEYPVPPLVTPPLVTPPLGMPRATDGPGWVVEPERLNEYSAAALFLERARAVQPDFALTDANAPAVAAICARLDGLPLAIELAAARVKVLPPAALLARLATRMDLLSRGARDVEARQQTMRNTLAWSYDLLLTEEQRLFCRLAVFVGGCTLQAAEAVCMAPSGVAPLQLDLLDGLSALVDQSLALQQAGDGSPRFGLLNVIREYALDQLEASGEGEALRRAHAAYALALVERAEPELTGPHAGEWLGLLEQEHDNLRAALRWIREHEETEMGLRLVAAVFRFWMVRGHLQEGRAWVEQFLALGSASASEDADAAERVESSGTVRAAPANVRARALRAAGVLALYQGDERAADECLEQATTLARAAGDLRTAAHALSSRGVTALHRGDLEQAGAHLEESLALMRTVGEQRDIAAVLTNLAIVHYERSDLQRAARSFSEALTVARQVVDRDLIATSLANLAGIALRQGDVEQADTLGREALALYHALGDPRRCAVGLEGLANSAGMAGRGLRAARLLGAAAALREELGAPLPPNERADVEQAVASARATLGPEQWALALAEGRALTLGQAVKEALGEEEAEAAGARSASATSPAGP